MRPRTIPRAVTFRGLAAVALVPALLAGCIQGEGPVVAEQREVRPFAAVEVGSGIQLVVRTGDAAPIEVAAQANILQAVETVVRADTLHIDASDDFTTTEPVTVTVTTPLLTGITAGGGAQARIEDLDAGPLDITVKGGARLWLAGVATDVTLFADGGSLVDLGGLAASRVVLTLDGGADATVAAGESVRGSASGGAHLFVSGDARIDVATSTGAEVTGPAP